MRLTARFYVRGGIFTSVVAEHRNNRWKPQNEILTVEVPTEPSTRP
jgi:7-cyano-7-deazaguanine reductase